MKSTRVKNTFIASMIGLVLMLNLQYYFFNTSSFNSFSSQKHYSKTTDAGKTNTGDTSIIDEDETSETELPQACFIAGFFNSTMNVISNIKLLNFHAARSTSAKLQSQPLYLLIMLWRI